MGDPPPVETHCPTGLIQSLDPMGDLIGSQSDQTGRLKRVLSEKRAASSNPPHCPRGSIMIRRRIHYDEERRLILLFIIIYVRVSVSLLGKLNRERSKLGCGSR